MSTSPTASSVVLHARVTLSKGHEGAFERLIAPLVRATRAERGCRVYRVYASLETPLERIFVEEWESRDALEAHFKTPHFLAYKAAVPALLAAEPELRIFDVARTES